MAIAQYSFYVKHTTMALLMRLNAPMAVTAESKFLSLEPYLTTYLIMSA